MLIKSKLFYIGKYKENSLENTILDLIYLTVVFYLNFFSCNFKGIIMHSSKAFKKFFLLGAIIFYLLPMSALFLLSQDQWEKVISPIEHLVP